MKTILVSIGIAVLLSFGVSWLIGSTTAKIPSVTVTSPASKVEWQTGDTHTISWETTNIATTDRVSVTIRRIPPPPLAEEGQEFDPVVFINLPNTGSVEWQIDSMYPTGNYILELHTYGSLPKTENISTQSKPFIITNTSVQ